MTMLVGLSVQKGMKEKLQKGDKKSDKLRKRDKRHEEERIQAKLLNLGPLSDSEERIQRAVAQRLQRELEEEARIDMAVKRRIQQERDELERERAFKEEEERKRRKANEQERIEAAVQEQMRRVREDEARVESIVRERMEKEVWPSMVDGAGAVLCAQGSPESIIQQRARLKREEARKAVMQARVEREEGKQESSTDHGSLDGSGMVKATQVGDVQARLAIVEKQLEAKTVALVESERKAYSRTYT